MPEDNDTYVGGLEYELEKANKKIEELFYELGDALKKNKELEKEINAYKIAMEKVEIILPPAIGYNKYSGTCSQCGHWFTAHERGYNRLLEIVTPIFAKLLKENEELRAKLAEATAINEGKE